MKYAEKQKFKRSKHDFFKGLRIILANVISRELLLEKNQLLPRLRKVKMKKRTRVNINAQYAWPRPNTMTWCMPMIRKPTASERIIISRSFIG